MSTESALAKCLDEQLVAWIVRIQLLSCRAGNRYSSSFDPWPASAKAPEIPPRSCFPGVNTSSPAAGVKLVLEFDKSYDRKKSKYKAILSVDKKASRKI